ncbi:MAG TPA: hypothetical protein VIF33_08230 [Casimicrobiaceae bacterium]
MCAVGRLHEAGIQRRTDQILIEEAVSAAVGRARAIVRPENTLRVDGDGFEEIDRQPLGKCGMERSEKFCARPIYGKRQQ